MILKWCFQNNFCALLSGLYFLNKINGHMMQLRKSSIVKFVLCSLATSFFLSKASISQEVSTKPFKIFMVQWRGDTETDRGFQDYFNNNRIAVNYTIRNPNQDRSQFVEIVKEIKEQKPDLVYTWSMASAQGIIGTIKKRNENNFLSDLPVVNCMVSDPVVAGISSEWGKTGRNFTGVSHIPRMPAQLQAMKSFKDINKLSIVYNSQQESAASAAMELENLARSQEIAVQSFPIPLNAEGKSSPEAIKESVAKAAASEPDFLYLGPDSFLYVNRKILFEAINEHSIPTFTSADVFLSNGDALFGLVGSYYTAGQYCGHKAAEILKKSQFVGDIPFDTLHNFSLKVNMETAKSLEIYPPMNLLTLTEVIKSDDTF